MPNKTLTSTEVAINAIDVLHNNSYMLKVIDKQHTKEFGKTGAQIGSTFNIKRPWKPTVYRQTALVAQSFAEDMIPLTLQYPYQVGLNFTTQELSLSVQNFRKQVLNPSLPAMATAIDLDALGLTYNGFLQIGTPGTTPGTSGGTFAGAGGATGIINNYNSPAWPLFSGALLDGQAAPRDGRREIILNQWGMAQTVAGLSGLLNPQAGIGEQYKKGVMTDALDFRWAMDQNIRNLLTGVRTVGSTPLVFGASQVGANLVSNGWASGAYLNAGEIIMVQGIYHVNPENQQGLTAYQATFVVTSQCVANSAGVMTIPIYPSIIPTVSTSAYGTVTASPASGATITLMSGADNTFYPVNVAFHGDAFTMATADLVMPNNIDFAARETYENISILLTKAYDITNLQFPARCDILAGYACTRPELVCRVTG